MRKIAAVVAAVAMWSSASVASALTLADAQHEVQREFRFYRITVYNSYRTLRPEYNARRQAGTQALAAWKNAGGQAHQAQPLLQWFRDAKTASQRGVNMPLPPLPEFPEALATTPAPRPAADAARSQASSRRASSRSSLKQDKRYRVREVATRSTANPYGHPAPQSQTHQQQADSQATPVWRTLSRALWKGMTFSSTREESKQNK